MDITNRIEDYLNEAISLKVEFDPSNYKRSHMKNPAGRGSWAFGISKKLTSEEAIKHFGTKYGSKPHESFVYLSPSMTYVEAKKWFKELLQKESKEFFRSNIVYVDVEG